MPSFLTDGGKNICWKTVKSGKTSKDMKEIIRFQIKGEYGAF